MRKGILVPIFFLFSSFLFSLELTSPAFKNGGKIPKVYTCDGEDISVPLKIKGIPGKAKALVLIMDDPDAPMGTWVHWVMYNIPTTTKVLNKNIPRKPILPDGSMQGRNSWGKIGYGGPCPPKITGEHRYFLKLYAIDKKLKISPGATKNEVLKKIEGHIIAKTSLMGKYKRQ